MTKYFLAAALLLSGCATAQLESHVGESMETVIAENGPPDKEIDIDDGRRAFKYGSLMDHFDIMRHSSYRLTAPGESRAPNAPDGFTVQYGYLIPTVDMMVGGVPKPSNCSVVYIAQWDSARQGWFVVDYRPANQVMC